MTMAMRKDEINKCAIIYGSKVSRTTSPSDFFLSQIYCKPQKRTSLAPVRIYLAIYVMTFDLC